MMTRRNTYVCTERPGAERPSLLPNGKENRYEGRAATGKERWGIGEQAPLSKMLDIMGWGGVGGGESACLPFLWQNIPMSSLSQTPLKNPPPLIN